MLADLGKAEFLAHFVSTAVIGVVTLVVLLRVERLLVRVAQLVGRVEDEFAYQHRVRTPVATIHGLVQVLERGAVAPEQQAAIFRAIDEQVALFNDPESAPPRA